MNHLVNYSCSLSADLTCTLDSKSLNWAPQAQEAGLRAACLCAGAAPGVLVVFAQRVALACQGCLVDNQPKRLQDHSIRDYLHE